MNRLTKQISLVLVSSSLVLHGCHSEPVAEAEKTEEEKAAAAGPAGQGSTSGHPHHWGPHFFHGSRGISSSPGARSSAGSRFSAGGSTRGGFGASAHGVAS